MQIDMLAGNTVKITLQKSDMLMFNVSYEDISGKGHNTRLALSRLIAMIGEEQKLDLSGERLLVEAFPSGDGGCMLYLSCLGSARSKTASKQSRTLICECDSIDNMISLCCALYAGYNKLSSKLYYNSSSSVYRLVISSASLSRAVSAVAGEFSCIKPYSLLGETEEYYSLISSNAINEMYLLK